MEIRRQEERWLYESLITKNIFWSMAAILALVLGWLGLGITEEYSRGEWFAKSGAFATAATLWSSRAEAQFISRYGHTASGDVAVYEMVFCASKWIPRLGILNIAVAICSAVVWGYGDVLFNSLMLK